MSRESRTRCGKGLSAAVLACALAAPGAAGVSAAALGPTTHGTAATSQQPARITYAQREPSPTHRGGGGHSSGGHSSGGRIRHSSGYFYSGSSGNGDATLNDYLVGAGVLVALFGGYRVVRSLLAR